MRAGIENTENSPAAWGSSSRSILLNSASGYFSESFFILGSRA